MTLKKCCRTCKFLKPQTYEDGDYDWEENYISDPQPCNCNMRECNEDVDYENDCPYYEQIDVNIIFKK